MDRKIKNIIKIGILVLVYIIIISLNNISLCATSKKNNIEKNSWNPSCKKGFQLSRLPLSIHCFFVSCFLKGNCDGHLHKKTIPIKIKSRESFLLQRFARFWFSYEDTPSFCFLMKNPQKEATFIFSF